MKNINKAIDILNKRISELESDWILLSENNPPIGKRILVQDSSNFVCISKLIHGSIDPLVWQDDDGEIYNYDSVIYWKPLIAKLT